jgi:hypothetical protein
MGSSTWLGCIFESFSRRLVERVIVFLIYIDNQIVEKIFDVILSAGGKGVPIYIDYAVLMPGA